jgi:23S rRNA (guanosine2251-2'-O)-methyltransferase
VPYGGLPRPGRPGLPPPDALGPDEELVAGRRPVEEAFVARRPARRLLVVPQRRQALERIVLHATSLRIPIVEVEGGSLTALAGFDGHQGVALVVEPRRFATIDDVLARAAERGEPPLILVLDSLEDPHNVGSLLRSAEGAGVHGVLFPVKRQAPLTPSAIKASAGAVEHLLMVPVDDLASALVDLHGHGVWVAGADGDAPLTARQTDLRGPIAIVVGSEGQGLGPAVRKRCDLFVRIPLRGAIGSLNAAVAGSVLLFEVAAQRDPEGTASRPAARNVQTVFTPANAADAADAVGPAVVSADLEPEPEDVTDHGSETPEPVAATPRQARAPRARRTLAVAPAQANDAVEAIETTVGTPAKSRAAAEPRVITASTSARTTRPAVEPKPAKAVKPSVEPKAAKPPAKSKPAKTTKPSAAKIKPAKAAETKSTKTATSTKTTKPSAAKIKEPKPARSAKTRNAAKPATTKATKAAAKPKAAGKPKAPAAPKTRAAATSHRTSATAANAPIPDDGDGDLLPE